MKIEPYLNFNGDCQEAFRFYEKILGGRIEAITTHGESPIAAQVPADWQHLVLHARMTVGDIDLMGSDSPPDQYEPPRGIWVSVNIVDPVEAERVFKALAENGTIVMPFDQTFWAKRFGMLFDRFGIPWMINCPRDAG